MLDGYMSEARDTLFQAPHFNSGLSTPGLRRTRTQDPQVPSPTLQFRAVYVPKTSSIRTASTPFQAPHFNSGLSTAPTEARCASTDPGVIFERC